MAVPRVFVSFDAEHDEDLKILLAGQAKKPDTPFSIADWSVKEAMTGDWKAKVRQKIKQVDQLVVVCGEHTDTATGVSAELTMAEEEGIPYFLISGRAGKSCKKPTSAKTSDKMYDWTWPNLKILFSGGR